MDRIIGKLDVFFEDPFWVGVLERQYKGKMTVAKITFGPEPKDYQVYDFILHNYHSLKFSPSVDAVIKEMPKNPKRMQRSIGKQLHSRGTSTKSQQALKLQQEENKLERKTISKEQKEMEKQRQFEIRQQKKKEKHRGR